MIVFVTVYLLISANNILQIIFQYYFLTAINTNKPVRMDQSRTEGDVHRADGTHCTYSVVQVLADRWQHLLPVDRIAQQGAADTVVDNSVGLDMAYLIF